MPALARFEPLIYLPAEIAGVSMADKPSYKPIAKALPVRTSSGFHGQFALPGLVPALVRKDGAPAIFSNEVQAEFAALRALFRLLTSRTTDTRKASGYKRITGADLADLLHAAGLTPTLFAEVYGVPQSRVMKWLDGEQDIPHSAHVLVRLLATKENFVLADEITAQAQQEGQ
jgi:DNA-binding transcriptional regulator YiaG